MSYIQRPEKGDYGYTWWKNGWKGAQRSIMTCNGTFGAEIDTEKGTIPHFGCFSETLSEREAAFPDDRIDSLPPLTFTPVVTIDGVPHAFLKMEPIEEHNPAYLNGTESSVMSSCAPAAPKDDEAFNGGVRASGVYNRILESGRIVQRNDVMCYVFEDLPGVRGRAELMLLPDHCAMSFELFGLQQECEAELSLRFDGTDTGEGMLVNGLTVLPSNCIFDQAFRRTFTVPCGSFDGITVIICKQAPDFKSISVEATAIMPQGGQQQVTYMKEGVFNVDQNGMFSESGASFTEDNVHTCDMIALKITNTSDRDIRMPLRFTKTDPLSLTGLCPLLCDTEGKPIGVPVQLTKNWHCFPLAKSDVCNSAPTQSPKRHFEGRWFHGYTILNIPANSTYECRYVCTFAFWGSLYAVSHSQLCLAGWGGGQQWETAAVGSFGESFCYDIARTWTWCCMGDICPVGVYSRLEGRKYDWTGNVGGGDFLFYESGKTRVGFAAMHTNFRKQGPCLSEVIYTGYTEDYRVKVEITVQMGRACDLARGFHHFKYTFLKDVSYDRMVFYQLGSDSYNYGFWDKLAFGTSDGLNKEYTLKGEGRNKVQMTPPDTWGDSFAVACPKGDGLWASLYGAEKGNSYGNKVLLVDDYNAVINGVQYQKPTVGLRTSNILNRWFGAFPELIAPEDAGGIIKAGSVVEGRVEYICPPPEKSVYYGGSPWLLSLPDCFYDSWKMAAYFCANRAPKIKMISGELSELFPVKIHAPKGAELSFKGGFAQTPVTFTGLPDTDFKLLQKSGSAWQDFDQSYFGNDFWQCFYDAAAGSYEMTFNLPPDAGEIRLVRC